MEFLSAANKGSAKAHCETTKRTGGTQRGILGDFVSEEGGLVGLSMSPAEGSAKNVADLERDKLVLHSEH